jgi:hypothetical protein
MAEEQPLERAVATREGTTNAGLFDDVGKQLANGEI